MAPASPPAAALRVAVLASVSAAAGVSLVLGLVFWAILTPVESGSCNASGPLPGPYAGAMAPLHVAAAVVLGGCLAWLSTLVNEGRRPGTPTAATLGLIAAFTIASLVEPGLFGLVGLVAIIGSIPLGGALAIGVAAMAVVTARADVEPVLAWRRHATTTQLLLWGGLVLGLPAHYSFAWLNGSSLFCF